MAPHSSTFPWKIPWTEEPGGLQSMGSLELDTTERLHFHFSLSCIGEGNGNPLQCSCLENLRNGEAWRAAVYGVAQSRTRLKRLSSSSSSRSATLNYFLAFGHWRKGVTGHGIVCPSTDTGGYVLMTPKQTSGASHPFYSNPFPTRKTSIYLPCSSDRLLRTHLTPSISP